MRVNDGGVSPSLFWFSSKMEDLEPMSRVYYSCSLCDDDGDDLYTLADYTLHVQDRHGEEEEEDEEGDGGEGIQRRRRRRDRIACVHCSRRFVLAHALGHYMKYHSRTVHMCLHCPDKFNSRRAVMDHARDRHSVPPDSSFREIESAFHRRVQTFSRTFPRLFVLTVEQSFQETRAELGELILRQLAVKHYIRFSIVVFVQYRQEDAQGHVEQTVVLPLRVGFRNIYRAHGRRGIFKEMRKMERELSARNETIESSGSNWQLDFVSAVNVEIGKLTLMGGCPLTTRLELSRSNIPQTKSRFLVDVPANDNRCFFYALGLALASTVESGRDIAALTAPRRRLLADTAVATRLKKTHEYPVPFRVSDIPKFEKQNKGANFAVNLFVYEEGEVIPVYRSIFNGQGSSQRKTINLLLIGCAEVESHYCWIRDLDLFCAPFNGKREFLCEGCLTPFSRRAALTAHEVICTSDEIPAISFPTQQCVEKFTSLSKKVLQPIIGVLDFESSLVPVSRAENAEKYECASCAEEGPTADCTHNTHDIHRQVPSTYCLIIADVKGKILYQRVESMDEEEDLMADFFGLLAMLEPWLKDLSQQNAEKTDYTRGELNQFRAATECYLCHGALVDGHARLAPVKDHCHYTGEYLGAAHNDCNWNCRRVLKRIPVFVHNFKNYDSHFLLKAMENADKNNIEALPVNMEKFRTLTVNYYAFVDSVELIPGALATLVNTLAKSGHSFPYLDQLSFCQSEERKKLLLRKGVFPYEWAESLDKLRAAKELPPRECFFSSLTQTGVSPEDYEHGRAVYEVFECQNMLDYCELYCHLDTVLLLEVLCDFRATIFKEFGLDSTRYISIPQLAYDCMLKTLDKPIGGMGDAEMILMCERNIRGGVSYINERHVQLSDYQDCEATVQDQLLYTDANNLYSVAQSAPVPCGDFEWCADDTLEQLKVDILSAPVEGETGYILEVDLTYPAELHEAHASMPLAPEQEELTFADLSPYSQRCLIHLQGESRARKYKSKKLCSTLRDKKKYVVHFRNLQTYVRLGMRLTKIHRAFRFAQSPVIRNFIQLCTEKRKQAATAAEKNVWKLTMNSTYGKFIQVIKLPIKN